MPHRYFWSSALVVLIALGLGLGDIQNIFAADPPPPVVGELTPGAAVAGTPIGLSALVKNIPNSAAALCGLYIGDELKAYMSPSGAALASDGYITVTYTFQTAGTYLAGVRCWDSVRGETGNVIGSVISLIVSAENTGSSEGVTAPVADTIAPIVGVPSPLTTTLGSAITFSSTYSDSGSGVSACYFRADGATGLVSGPIGMNRTGTPAAGTATYTISSAFFSSGSSMVPLFSSNYTITITCIDVSGNSSIPVTRTVVVSPPATSVTAPVADTIAPIVSAVSPTIVTMNSPVSLSGIFSDAVGVTGCSLYVDGINRGSPIRTGTANNGDASLSHNFTTAGTHSARLDCIDAAGNLSTSVSTPITVIAPSTSPDISAPSVGVVLPNTATINAPVYFTTSASDAVQVVACYAYIDGVSWGLMSRSSGNALSGIYSLSHRFTTPGSHTALVRCTDAAGNIGESINTVVTVQASVAYQEPLPPTNSAAPIITSVYPLMVGAGAVTSYVANYRGNNNTGVNGCSFYVNGIYTGVMSLSTNLVNGNANYNHAFSTPGRYQVWVECVDQAGNRGYGPRNTLVVTGANSALVPPSDSAIPTTLVYESARTTLPETGTLIKLPCANNATVSDSCKVVYYYGNDRRRHAFPNERVYFSWYDNFNGVTVITAEAMASASLGANVTYRPGVRLIKFPTVPQVYVVTRRGILRWISSEEIAIELYGSNWSRNVDDVSDSFYTNYTFGSDITRASQYNPLSETSATVNINDNF